MIKFLVVIVFATVSVGVVTLLSIYNDLKPNAIFFVIGLITGLLCFYLISNDEE